MTREVVTLRPTQTLREATRALAQRRVAAAVVVDEDYDQPAFLTEHDIVTAVGRGLDIDEEHVGDHLDDNLVLVGRPDWPLDRGPASCSCGQRPDGRHRLGARHPAALERAATSTHPLTRARRPYHAAPVTLRHRAPASSIAGPACRQSAVGGAQQIRGSASPTSMSTTRLTPTMVVIATRPAGPAVTVPT